jgi:photosystem II stability/assembly factor-like uncharacterized protein
MNILLFLFSFLLIFSQQTPNSISSYYRLTDSDTKQKAFQKHKEMKGSSEFSSLKWQNIGPTIMGGRITDIAVPKDSYFTFYVSTAAGGVWKTENNGSSWQPIFDNYSSSSIGDIAVSESNSEVIWVGTGENNSLRSSYAGTGIFKSTDAGKTFKHMGLSDSHHIGRVIIHPNKPEIVYVAVIGHLYTSNIDRGLYKTLDAGETWTKILDLGSETGVIDVAFAPNNPEIIYAASWERSRKAWDFKESGDGSGVHISKDSGKTWEKMNNGFPVGNYIGRIGFATTVSNPSVLYAVVDNQSKKEKASQADKERQKWANATAKDSVLVGIELYKSDDYGTNWKLVSKNLDNSKLYSSYGYFFGNMAVSPKNENQLYLMGIHTARSDDGGMNWTYVSENKGVHADFHAIWINPNNDKHIIIGNDGGIDISYDAGETWQAVKNLPIGQFYTIEVDMENPYNLYGGLQDNGTYMGSSDIGKIYSDIMGNSNKQEWKFLTGGDGFHVQVDKENPKIYFSESQWGYLYRTIGDDRKAIRPTPKNSDEKYRFNWSSPIVLSKHNSQTIYFGGNKLFKSLNRGDTWHEISPDLSDNDAEKKGNVTFGTITSISESELDPNLLYVGTDDGNLWVTKNAGFNWDKINTSVPKRWVSRIIASKHELSKVYASFTGYREDEMTSYLFSSSDYGGKWNKITGNLPIEPINVIREDLKNENILYIGTDLGVYLSTDKGKLWKSLSANMPTVPVHDLIQHPREMDLLAATHGRSVYKINADIISQYADSVYDEKAFIFNIDKMKHSYKMFKNFYFTINNQTSILAQILDSEKTLVKEYDLGTLKKGYHQVYWDGLKKDPKNRWDIVDTGDYIFRIKVKNKDISKKFRIVND